MCDKCIDAVKHLKNTSKNKLPEELRANLPGKVSRKRVADMSPEEYEAHRIHARAYNAIYKEYRNANDGSHKIYQDAYQKAYQINHKTEMREYQYKYRTETNPEYTKQMYRRRRAKKKAVESQHYSTQDILAQWGTDCHICKEPIDLEAPRYVGAPGWERALHLDHVIPLASGGSDTVDNVKPAHGRCNISKNDKIIEGAYDVEESLKVLFSKKFGQKPKGRPKLDSKDEN